MTLLMILLCMTGQSAQGEDGCFYHEFRLGICLFTSIPAMQMEKDFADICSRAGVGYELDTFAWDWSIEFLRDLSERFRIRGSAGISSFNGSYKKYITMHDRAFSIDAQAFFLVNRGKDISFSAGAGPVYVWVSRNLYSDNTTQAGSGSNIGLIASLRLDQEWPWKIGNMSLLLALEAGYRSNSVVLDNEEADGFEVDFSGPFFKFGSYIGL
ncbi:MAG: hypothetical protein ABFR50_06745 [Candidatus Fermentibacteria bacterium]